MQGVEKLKQIVATAPKLLGAIPPKDAAKQPTLVKWSKKQELGHLIDSACNNHQRIVRAQIEEEPSLGEYDGDLWVALHKYSGNGVERNYRMLASHERAAYSSSERHFAADCRTQADGRRSRSGHARFSSQRLRCPSPASFASYWDRCECIRYCGLIGPLHPVQM